MGVLSMFIACILSQDLQLNGKLWYFFWLFEEIIIIYKSSSESKSIKIQIMFRIWINFVKMFKLNGIQGIIN